ncbi:MAG: hypothetical protein KOO69_07665, partial [Victivallales bacterium]|nr:hypothetical protein [Victivallales bacterium]
VIIMINITSNLSLLFLGALMLIGGCQHRYGYKYKNLEAWAVSDQADESKIRPHLISSIPHEPIPELMVMIDGKEIYLRQSLTKNEVLDFIKRNKIKHEFSAVPDWKEVTIPEDMDKIEIVLYAKNDGLVQLWFSEQLLVESVYDGKGESLKIASPKNKKYYSMPITVLQMKEIFGEPLESMSAPSIK